MLAFSYMRLTMRWRYLVVLIVGGLLIVQFQNCSQVNGHMTAEEPLIAVQPGARISDDWRSDPLVFAYPKVEVAEHLEGTNFYGLCLRQSQSMPLTWKLEEDGQVVLQGSTSCLHGNFQIELNDLQGLPCGNVHRLMIEDAALGVSANMMLSRRCPAVHSQEESNGCVRERVLTENGSPACEYVCYDHGIVVQKESLALDLCPASGS